jgi:hypothetical protein
MANSLLTINMITREAIRLFINTNAFIQNIDRQYDDQFAVTGAKIGTTLRIRLPNDYIVTDGPGLSLQDTAEQQITLTLATQRHVDVAFTTAERTLSLDDYSDRVLKPKVNALCGNVASTVMTNIAEASSNITFNAAADNTILKPTSEQFLTAGAILDDNSAPMLGTKGDRKIVNDPWTDARTVNSLTGLLNPSGPLTEQYMYGTMKQGLGFSWFRDQTVIKHTTGSFSAGGAVAGANQTGTSITVTAITGTLKMGDIVVFDGVNAVNRVTKQTTGMQRQFVVTGDVAAGGTAVGIYPALVPAQGGSAVQYQTVDVSPANGAQMSLVTNASSTYRKSLAYAPEAITMVTADLFMPTKGVIEASRQSMDGVSMRSLSAYLPGTDQVADRLDVLFGSLMVRGEWTCVVADTIR